MNFYGFYSKLEIEFTLRTEVSWFIIVSEIKTEFSTF